MAAPTNPQRGLPEVADNKDAQSTSRRGTETRGIPPDPYAGLPSRFLTYRYEDTVKEFRPGSDRIVYPFWKPVYIPSGQKAPDRMEFPNGTVAYRAEPDWHAPREGPLTPPPLVKAVPPPPPPPPPPPKKKVEKHPPPPPPPPPKPPPPPGPIQCQPGYVPTRSGKACMPSDELQHARDEIGKAQERRQAIRDYTDATLGDGFENASKVAKWASKIPGPAGRIFKGVQVGLETAHDLYEAGKLLEQLIVEMKQADAAEKGTEVLAKKGEDVLTKKAEKTLDKILARKGITIPEPLKKEVIKRARDYFDKKVRDPAIKAGKKELEKTIDEKDKNKSLWDVFNRGSTLYR